MRETLLERDAEYGAGLRIGQSAPKRFTAFILGVALAGGAAETAQANGGRNLPLKTVENRVEKRLLNQKDVGFALGTIYKAGKVIQHPLAIDRRKPGRVIDMNHPAKRGSTAYCAIDRETDEVDCISDRVVYRFRPQINPKRYQRLPRPIDSFSTFFKLEPVRSIDGEVPPPKLDLENPMHPTEENMVLTDAYGNQLDVGLDITNS